MMDSEKKWGEEEYGRKVEKEGRGTVGKVEKEEKNDHKQGDNVQECADRDLFTLTPLSPVSQLLVPFRPQPSSFFFFSFLLLLVLSSSPQCPLRKMRHCPYWDPFRLRLRTQPSVLKMGGGGCSFKGLFCLLGVPPPSTSVSNTTIRSIVVLSADV